MCELQWGGRNQDGAGATIGEEVEQVNSFLSRAAICSKYMSKAVRTDMLTIQAIGWNKRKVEKLDLTLAKRYIKTVQRISEASADLGKLTQDLSIQEDMVQQWVSDVKEWAAAPFFPGGSGGTGWVLCPFPPGRSHPAAANEAVSLLDPGSAAEPGRTSTRARVACVTCECAGGGAFTGLAPPPSR
ncbi:hypothetical protein OJAV_G00222770 [Oryzias javanicus]|uniref:Uncharacterized protein n=1 Tax=Oryzias javanicus TaxID=123683 RepID=A0A3S2P3Z8_ORYJA|nr:hypothetical protein OJAV_G00222770 [Oryzias javanicus]